MPKDISNKICPECKGLAFWDYGRKTHICTNCGYEADMSQNIIAVLKNILYQHIKYKTEDPILVLATLLYDRNIIDLKEYEEIIKWELPNLEVI